MATDIITVDTLDIRDVEMGTTYYVVTDPNRGGRCVMHPWSPMFIAAWLRHEEAKAVARKLGKGFGVAAQLKN